MPGSSQWSGSSQSVGSKGSRIVMAATASASAGAPLRRSSRSELAGTLLPSSRTASRPGRS